MLQWVQTGKSLKNSQAMIRQHKTCLGCGPQGRREAFRGRTIKRASSLAGFGRTEGEETSGLNLGQNAQEVLRDSRGGSWSESFWTTVCPPQLLKDQQSSSHGDSVQQSSSERLGEGRPLGWEPMVLAKSGETSTVIYVLPSFGKGAGGGHILSFEDQQAKAVNSHSQAVGDETGKAAWRPVKEA